MLWSLAFRKMVLHQCIHALEGLCSKCRCILIFRKTIFFGLPYMFFFYSEAITFWQPNLLKYDFIAQSKLILFVAILRKDMLNKTKNGHQECKNGQKHVNVGKCMTFLVVMYSSHNLVQLQQQQKMGLHDCTTVIFRSSVCSKKDRNFFGLCGVF